MISPDVRLRCLCGLTALACFSGAEASADLAHRQISYAIGAGIWCAASAATAAFLSRRSIRQAQGVRLLERGPDSSLHDLPDGDLVMHEVREDCPCGPVVQPVKQADGTVDWLVRHVSLDGRE